MKTITISEDVEIPGTDYILEKGDYIQIQESRKKKSRKTESDTGKKVAKAAVEMLLGDVEGAVETYLEDEGIELTADDIDETEIEQAVFNVLNSMAPEIATEIISEMENNLG